MSGGKASEKDSEILRFMNWKLCSNCLPQFQWTQLISIWPRAGKFMYTLLFHAVWNCDLIHQWIFLKHQNILTWSYPGWYYYYPTTALFFNGNLIFIPLFASKHGIKYVLVCMVCVNYKTYLIYSRLWQLEDWVRFTVKLWKDTMSWVFVITILSGLCNQFLFHIFLFAIIL